MPPSVLFLTGVVVLWVCVLCFVGGVFLSQYVDWWCVVQVLGVVFVLVDP